MGVVAHREVPGAAAHAFVADLDDPVLDGPDRHHLERALRLRAGEALTLSDGAGGWRLCRWTGGGAEADGPVVRQERPCPAVTVGFCLLKGDGPEWVVQRLTEAGVDRILLLTSRHTVVRWDDARAAKAVERLRRVAREAAMQSRRVWLPDVGAVRPLAAAAGELGPGAALAHRGGAPPSLRHPAVLVGPEGGWSDDELSAPLPRVDLGPTVLRAGTAALAAGLLLAALRSGVVAAAQRDRGGSRTGTEGGDSESGE